MTGICGQITVDYYFSQFLDMLLEPYRFLTPTADSYLYLYRGSEKNGEHNLQRLLNLHGAGKICIVLVKAYHVVRWHSLASLCFTHAKSYLLVCCVRRGSAFVHSHEGQMTFIWYSINTKMIFSRLLLLHERFYHERVKSLAQHII